MSTLADLSDAELEARFLEAERNALAWCELGVGVHSERRGARWMEIAAEIQAEISRRSQNGLASKPARKPRSRTRRR